MPRTAAGGRSRQRLDTLTQAVLALPHATPIVSVKPAGDSDARVAVRFGKLLRLTLASRDAALLGLTPGATWDASRRDELALAVHADEARRWAVTSLNRRAQSSGQLVDKLISRGTPPTVARAIAGEMKAIGALDDDAVAESAARAMVARRPAGQRLIESKLRAKRVDGDTARRAAARAVEGRDALADALALAAKHARAMPAKLDAAARQRRLLGALARRGFDADICREAVRRTLGKGAEAPGDD